MKFDTIKEYDSLTRVIDTILPIPSHTYIHLFYMYVVHFIIYLVSWMHA